jgi:biopolymer transport protein ExbD
MRKPTRSKLRRQRQTEVNQELELMPMLNVFISIIPLLLLSAAFVQLAVIPTALPASATAPPSIAVAAEDKLSLSIVIQAEAYVVEANGATVSTIARPAHAAPGDPTAKAARDQLGQALSAITAQHPDHREVKIVADPATRYEDIIDVMDVSRAAGMPDAALADAGV